MQAFDGMLKEHQRASLPDGYSVLESAVIQHNIRSVSKMYHNIAIEQLAALLGLPETQVLLPLSQIVFMVIGSVL